MSKPAEFEFVEFDFDAVWAALGKSTQLDKYLESLAKQVEQECVARARATANDDGYYANNFVSQTDSAANVRREFQDTYNERRNRRRRGTVNRVIDAPTIKGEDGKPVKVKGDPDGSEYKGQVGIVANTDFKAVWVEYGTVVKGPRLVMSQASEAIANRNGAEWEPLYGKRNEQNLAQHRENVSRGMEEYWDRKGTSK
jgi:hypothetical protein